MAKRGLFDKGADHEASGVSIASLKKSREVRRDFIVKYGSIPTSILVHDRHQKAMDLIRDGLEEAPENGRSYEKCRFVTGDPLLDQESNFYLRNRSVRKGKSYKSKRSYGSGDYKTGDQALDNTGFGARGHFVRQSSGVRNDPTQPAPLSSFFQNIGRLMIDFYCPEGGVVYDPFAGHNSRMELVWKSGRHYIGVDCSATFMHANEVIRDVLFKRNEQAVKKNDATVKLILGSSAKVDLPDNHADFTITSPPYYNLEWYGDEPEQLGNAPTYEKFLELLKSHVAENLRILKPGAFCAWFINDFRLDKIFYPYHMDLYRIFVEVGFKPFNIYIVDLGNPITQAFVQFIISSKIFPKRHEYCLLFRKGGE